MPSSLPRSKSPLPPTPTPPLPKGKLSTASYVDPRERELRLLQEVADDLEREAEEEEKLAEEAEVRYAEFIQAMEATYKDDHEGLAWFCSQCDDSLVDLQDELADAQTQFEAKAYKYGQEIEDLRREIHAIDVEIEKKKKGIAK
ncbi:unnamed protein product [Rhizoctonia solani]|uniref:Uncharacterized protein n=1 Tax=Rhizoctonia solani TaxID=456999 RepID=A0A8H3E3H4_9AGAM|nr:unnamed protein product [Rhizoctonia solani]